MCVVAISRKKSQLLQDLATSTANALGVWCGSGWICGRKNPKAIGFYEKHGFVTIDEHIIFTLGEDHQTDIVMKLNVK